LKSRLRYFEHQHQVELVCDSAEVLGERDLSAWLAETGQACERTAADGRTRTVAKGGSKASVFPTGQRPAGRFFTGPVIAGDVWRRVAIRIGEKAEQTTGSAAWLRIDDTGALLRFTDRSTQPLESLLADLQLNVAAALAGAPHVRGIILSGGTMIDPGNAQDVTAWERAGSATLITPGPPRHALADGPAAISRTLPGGRNRLTFILPNPKPHLVLPAGLGLEPGLWYHDEPSWLSRALQSLGHPPLAHLIPS
jgi:hypothetical protein